MARGFESKDVEFQQAEMERRGAPNRSGAAPHPRRRAMDAQHRTIELSLARARSQLAAAVQPAHRQMLESAINDLEGQLATLLTNTRR
jgi:uncharacterized protein involved in exopolysaccharide biosynthesis